jgi:NADH:ubiquinone oxidoreductase subunit 2 (subunit N)
MNINILLFKDIVIFSELFLGISIIYLVIHCTFLAVQKKYPLIQDSVIYLSVLSLLFSVYLILNEHLTVLEVSSLNNTFLLDYTGFFSKIIIGCLSLFCLIMMQSYIINQKINNFEYFLLILFSVLGLFLLCSSNDFLTSYLAIELQSLSFYVLAAFKKNSTFSVEAGIKYFVLGAFSSSMFLFGSSLLYGFTGTIYFTEFSSLFFNEVPGNDIVLNHHYYNDMFKSCVVEMRWSMYSQKYFVFFMEGTDFAETITNLVNFDKEILPTMCFLKALESTGEMVYLSPNTDNLFDTNLIKFALIFIFIGLFFKLTAAPFHIWAPDVYEGSPSSSTFFFSVVPKLAIFVLLLRIFYNSFYGFVDSWRYFIVLIIISSILVGSFGGLEQRKLKSLLVYSTISHMGYSLIAFSAGTFESLQMLISYLVVYSFSGLCVWSIFLIMRLKNNYYQKQNKDLTDLVLLSKSNPMVAVFFTTVLFSLAGFPPMIGFLVKLGVFTTAIESSMYFVALISILCSVVGTFYYIRLIKILYFEKSLTGKLYYPITTQSSIMVTLLFYLLLFTFINPTLLFLLSYKFSLLVFF